VTSDRPTISTHILDTGSGTPRAGATVRLWRLALSDGPATLVVEATTDDDGRARDMLGPVALEAGAYALEFVLGDDGFFSSMTVELRVTDPSRSYHVPLLVSPYGLSTYRGS
jgi:5-hydroxyisourate hydrolase